MKPFILFWIFLPLVFALQAQELQITGEYDEEGNYIVTCINNEVIPVSVIIEYPVLENLNPQGGRITHTVAYQGRTELVRMRRISENQSTSVQMQYKSQFGDIRAKTEENYPYLLPVEEGREVELLLLSNMQRTYAGDKDAQQFLGVAIMLEEPSAVVAPRKGIISSMRMDYQPDDAKVIGFTTDENFIEIFHEDGTFTELKVLEAGSARVKVGDVVYPGDVLARSAGGNYEGGNQVRMVTRSLKAENSDFDYHVFLPSLWSGSQALKPIHGQKLSASHPLELVEKEMTKKERKERGK